MNQGGDTNTLHRKLAILADAAKYDASCASSGAGGRNSRDGKGLGSTTGSGICHAYTPDGRCVSLLKVLLTNFCVYDCAFCVNRLSSDTPRARFKVEEIVALTLGFYRRNMIEGLFLSSGITKSEDHTMEEMVRVAETLRRDHEFRGYIHLKAIAGASQDLIERAGRAADRLSVNVELPDDAALARLAPQKDALIIRKAMGGLKLKLDEAKEERGKTLRAPRFAPAGQSTQMIIGADEARDKDVIARSCLPLCFLRPAASLLLGLQPNSSFLTKSAATPSATHARAPSLSGRLVDAALWLRAGGNPRSRGRRDARP